ncbi:TIGR02466 family protein [Sphingomonas humi]|uniref:TIGR02466 family protein n=1 Tax=Sphingomonas humi TaxID=335630 RepID=A0ABP7S039_9SPHN
MSRQLFATPLYEADLAIDLAEIAHSIRSLAEDDGAGRRWAKEHGYKGYTSYASLNDLPRRDPVFADLGRLLTRHAATFARDLAWDVKPKLDSLWVNLMKPGGHHSAHLHPHSILSGTFYVEVPEGAGAIRFEDPRLPMMMAAPTRRTDAPEPLQTFVTVRPQPGQLLLWESWLRHEVLPGAGRSERLSVSFNFA